MNPLIIDIEVFKVFAMVLVRCSGLMVSAPLLGSRSFPPQNKAGFAAMLAVLITPGVGALGQTLPDNALAFAVVGIGELMIGLLIGFVMSVAFAAIQVGGQLMDMQTGFGMMNVFNPAMETQFPIFGFYYYIIAVLFLLVTNGHHLMIRALLSTFDKIPLGGFVVNPKLMFQASVWGRAMFFDGLMIAAPIVGAMFLAYATMGLLGRVVPQISLFVVGFPVTIGLGLLIVGAATGIYISVIGGVFRRMFDNVAIAIGGMS